MSSSNPSTKCFDYKHERRVCVCVCLCMCLGQGRKEFDEKEMEGVVCVCVWCTRGHVFDRLLTLLSSHL